MIINLLLVSSNILLNKTKSINIHYLYRKNMREYIRWSKEKRLERVTLRFHDRDPMCLASSISLHLLTSSLDTNDLYIAILRYMNN